jgi:hypothetical protein
MSAFPLHIRTAWEDYFSATSTTKLNSQTFTSRQTPSNTGVYVLSCLFISIASSSGNGGALYSYNSATYLLIESTSFFSCSTSGSNGGAIYSSNTGSGQSVLHGVCGYDCYSNPYYQFARIEVSSTATSKDYFNYSSITRCVNENSNSWHVFLLYYGKSCCSSVNASLNKCRGQPFYYLPYKDSNSATCSILCSSFADNIATLDSICLMLWTTGAKYEIKSCNILRNTQVSTSYGTITTIGDLMIEDSCILENQATNIFHQESSSYTITLSNCTVDKTTCNRNLVTQNTVSKSFILALNHMSTQNCHSKYDSAGYLTPIIQTPSSSKKQINCYTGNKFLYQCPQGNIFLLASVSFVLKLLPQ